MSAPRVLRPDGAPLDASTLVAREVTLDEETTAAVLSAARGSGLVLERDGLALYGLGDAAIIELPSGLGDKQAARAAGDLLGAIPTEGAARAVAIGALPFLPTTAGHLVVPSLLLRRSGDGSFATWTAARDAGNFAVGELAPLLGTPHESAPPEHFHLDPAESHAAFRHRVRVALAEIAAGHLDKVVLAREVTVTADRDFRPEHLVARLRQLHPSCLTFSVEGIVGASPELLVRRSRQSVVSQPLAGTVGRSGDPEQDHRLASSLLSSAKDRAEHDFVVHAIRDALAPYCSTLHIPVAPHLLELRNVVHLATAIEGRLQDDPAGALELLAAIHPTPAVCGSPRDAALDLLGRSEHLERDRYAGPVGYLDGSGEGEFWLAIRSAMLDGPTARLLAGVGIVAGSVPDDELAETQLKLQALLAAAVRP